MIKAEKTIRYCSSSQLVLITDQVEIMPCAVHRALIFLGKTVPGGKPNCIVEVRLIGNQWCYYSLAITHYTLRNQHLLYNLKSYLWPL